MQAAQQPGGHRPFPALLACHRAHRGAGQRPGPAGDQRHHPQLRVMRRLGLRPAGDAERGDVLRAGGGLDRGPVPGHREQPADMGPRRPARRQHRAQPPEQQLQRPVPQPAPHLRQPGRRRDLPPRRCQRRTQPGDQLFDHLGIRLIAEQAQPQHEEHAHPVRQHPQPRPPRLTARRGHLSGQRRAGLGDHLINQPRRHEPRQHPDPDTSQDLSPPRRPPAGHATMNRQRSSSPERNDVVIACSSGSFVAYPAGTPTRLHPLPNP